MIRFKIANKVRFTIFIIIVVTFISFIVANIFENKVYSSTYDKYYEIIVVEGDTLWKIAKHNNPYNYDIRRVVDTIMTFNDMNDAKIKPGDIIMIPIK